MARTVSDEDDLLFDVVEQVAHGIGVSPLDLPPLATAIDPDVIEPLPESATLEFPYYGHTVTVQGDGTVTVQPVIGDDEFR